MSPDSTKCPYCGEEIVLGARKCRHCGEWLDYDTNKPSDDFQEVLTEEAIRKITEKRTIEVIEVIKRQENIEKFWTSVAVFVLVLVALFFTVPNEQKHISKVNEYADEYSFLLIKELKQLAAENKPALFKVSDFVTEDVCNEIRSQVKKACLESFDYTNCLLFSVGDIGGSTTQIGVFGFVIDFTPIDEDVIHNDVVNAWNTIVEDYNEGLGEIIDGILNLGQ